MRLTNKRVLPQILLICFVTFITLNNIPQYLSFAGNFFQNVLGYHGEITTSEVQYLEYIYSMNSHSITAYDLERNVLAIRPYWDLFSVNSSFIVSDPYTMFMSNRIGLSNVMMPEIGFVQEEGYSFNTLKLFNELKEALKSVNQTKIESLVESYLRENGLSNRTSKVYIVISTRTGMWLNSKSQFVSIDNFNQYDIDQINTQIKQIINGLKIWCNIVKSFSEMVNGHEYFVYILECKL